MKLLLSLYACEPNRGSEPGVGWAWALGMSRRHETIVLTRANNRSAIEDALDRLAIPPDRRPTFLYVDLPDWVCGLKKRGILPTRIYYFLWQLAARRAFDRSGLRVDIIHHVTFCSYVVPGFWRHRHEKVVLGPLGGFSVCPHRFLRAYPVRSRMAECLRGLSREAWRFAPIFRAAAASADRVFFTDRKIAARASEIGIRNDVLLDVAVPEPLLSSRFNEFPTKANQLTWAGTLAGHKACEIALRAYQRAFAPSKVPADSSDPFPPPLFKIFGDGPDRDRLRSLASELGIDRFVQFEGVRPQDELWAEIGKSKAFVFTSIRDTCGSVSLEALACQTPLVCFNHQGVGTVADETCAIAIEPKDWDDAIARFAEAMKTLAQDAGKVSRMGKAGRKRALEMFSWERKFDFVDSVYGEVLS